LELELLADDLAQDARRRGDALVGDQLVVLLDRPQRPRGVERQLAQELHPRGLVLPVALRLLARLSVVEAKSRDEPVGGLGIGSPDCVDQLADRGAHQRRRVLDRRRSQHRRRVEDLLRLTGEQAELGREFERALEHQPLLAVEEQPGAEANQRGRVKAGVVERQIERDLPAQIEANGVHRTLVGEPLAVGEQEHLGQQAGRDRGSTWRSE
jgi:hypothetical protein